MNFHILDTETSGLGKGAGVCEIAWLEVDNDLNVIREFCTLVNPQVPIDPGATLIHGITNEDVHESPTLNIVAGFLDGPIQMVAHNVSFDYRMVKDEIQVESQICTLKLARQFIKNTTNHKLETLQKELGFPVQTSHSALGDVHTCRDLLLYLKAKHGVTLQDTLVRQSIPQMVHLMPFGKHKGRVIANIAADYRDWLLSQEIDADLRFTLEKLKGV